MFTISPFNKSELTVQETNPSFVLRSVKDVVFEDRAILSLKDPWDVRVQIAQTGICGSDVHYWQRGRIGGLFLLNPVISLIQWY